MRKKIISGIIIAAMTMSACMVAVAAEDSSATKSDLHSKGIIHYSQGDDKVIIDSADLYKLADQLDLFKTKVIGQLGEMDTYLTRTGSDVALSKADGVYVVHSAPGEGEAVDPLSLDFAAVLESIAASQSVPTDPGTYGMSESTQLYKTWEGRLTTEASEGVESVSIQAATEDNLSAGAAAWVNGRLLLGTGADVADAAGGSEPLSEYDISSTYVMPENKASAVAFTYNIGSGSNDAAAAPVLSVKGGGTYELLHEHKFGRSGYSVKVAVYYLKNLSKGAKVQGSNGRLFY